MTFAFDPLPALIVILFIVLFYFIFTNLLFNSTPALFFSSLSLLNQKGLSKKKIFAPLPKWLLTITLFLFLLAFIDPRFHIPKTSSFQYTSEGIAIYLVLDQSSSMSSIIKAFDKDKKPLSLPKIDWLKQITEQFIKGNNHSEILERSNDLIGLIAFSRGAQVFVPLTLDHSAILRKLSQLQVVKGNEQDGTAIGYAIYKTALLFASMRHFTENLPPATAPAFNIKSAAAIVITDGFHSPNPLDKNNPLRSMELDQAALFAKEKNVHVYIVTIEPALVSEEFAPQRRQMEAVAQITGGKFFAINDYSDLPQIYQAIDQLEKSKLPTLNLPQQNYWVFPIAPYLIGIALALLLCAIVLETLWLRKVP